MSPMKETGQVSDSPVGAPPGERVGAGIDFTDPNSPLAPFYLRTGGVVACGLLALIFVVVSSIPLWHSDVWGHLKFGEWMATHRTLPRTSRSVHGATRKRPLCNFTD